MMRVERDRRIVNGVGDDAPCSSRGSCSQAPTKRVDQQVGSESAALVVGVDCQPTDEKEWNLSWHKALGSEHP